MSDDSPRLDPDVTEAATAAYVDDLERVAAIDADQLDYLARVADLDDPATDGVGCESP